MKDTAAGGIRATQGNFSSFHMCCLMPQVSGYGIESSNRVILFSLLYDNKQV